MEIFHREIHDVLTRSVTWGQCFQPVIITSIILDAMAHKQQYYVFKTVATRTSFGMDSSQDTIYNDVAEIIAHATDPITFNTYIW